MNRKNVSIIGNERVFYIFVGIITTVAFIITVYPFLYIVSVSLSSSEAVFNGKVFIWPVEPDLEGYRQVFKQGGLWIAYGNTIYYTVVGTLFNMVATTIAAYPLSRKRFFARRFLNFFVAFTMYFSGGIIPSYLLITSLGFYNTRWVMIIPGLLTVYYLMICRSAFSGIPDEVYESAEIEGANDWQIFTGIAVRLITPTLAVLTLYYVISHWNNYFTALLYISDEKLVPLQVLLRRVLIQSSGELLGETAGDGDSAAISIKVRYVTIVVATLPVLAFYPFVQKYFIKGIMLGAIKG